MFLEIFDLEHAFMKEYNLDTYSSYSSTSLYLHVCSVGIVWIVPEGNFTLKLCNHEIIVIIRSGLLRQI
jgi:hypothetical protein